MTEQNEIGLIFVLYHPTTEQLERIKNIATYYGGIIVDNSGTPNFPDERIGKMSYVINDNVGIATAQNIGIREIMASGMVSHVVFLDQDSKVSANYLIQIVEEYKRLSKNRKIATLGPTVIDETTDAAYASAFHKDVIGKDGFIARPQIISSGSVIEVNILKEVGLMEDKLFIDFVDFEWCWRAKAKGYVSGITTKLSIRHKVGVNELNIGKHKIIVSSPFRYFYQFRNLLWLAKRSYVPTRWKINYGAKMMARLIYFPFVLKDGWKIEKQMWKGIRHGLFKR